MVLPCDPRIVAAYDSLVAEVERIWAELVAAFGCPSGRRPAWNFHDGKVSLVTIDDPRTADSAIHHRADQLLQANEACLAFVAHIKDHLARLNLRPQIGSRIRNDYELLYVVVSHSYPLREDGRVVGQSQSEKEAALSRILAALCASTYSVDFAVPLLNFKSSGALSGVTTSVSLCPLSDQGKAELLDTFARHRAFPDPGLDISALARSDWALRLSRTFRRDEEVRYEELLSEVVRALSAFRLLKPGRMGSLAAVLTSDAVGNSIHDRPEIVVSPGGSQYELKEQDVDSLRLLGHALELPEAQPLEFALRWFNQAVGGQWSEGIVTAVAISLEAALLPNVRDEISFRLALRCAAILAAESDPEETFRTIRTLYSARSSIVHEGRTLSTLPKRVVRSIAELPGAPAPGALPSISLDVSRRVLRNLVQRLRPGVGHTQLLETLEANAIARIRPPKSNS